MLAMLPVDWALVCSSMAKRAVTTSVLLVVVLVSNALNHQAGERTEEMVQLSAVASGSLSE